MAEKVSDTESLMPMSELIRIGQEAVQKAQEESRRLGVPNVYSYDGVIYYELPNGELTTEVPEIYRTKPKSSSL